MARKSLQRRTVPKASGPFNLGPRYRTPSRRTPYPSRKATPPYSVRDPRDSQFRPLTPDKSHQPTVMFFGLTNSPATFQMMMNMIFRREIAQGWLSVYMDDLAIHTKRKLGETEEQHRERHRRLVHHVLDILEKHDLYLKPEKCSFEQEEIDYLGVIVGKDKLEMDPQKLSGVADWPIPKNPTDVHSFLT